MQSGNRSTNSFCFTKCLSLNSMHFMWYTCTCIKVIQWYMYAKDYEQGENKTNEGNDMYLLFCIVVRTYGNMQQTNKMVYNGLISFFLILNRNNFFLLNFINIKIFFDVQNVFYFLHTYCTSIFKTFAYRYFFFTLPPKKF